MERENSGIKNKAVHGSRVTLKNNGTFLFRRLEVNRRFDLPSQ